MNTTMEYIGEMLPDGRISVEPSIAHRLRTGEKLRIRIEQIPDESKNKGEKELDAATKRLLERMKNAGSLGTPDNPDELRHSVLMEERMEDKFPWRE
ncbi:hypothetical protein [Desulfonatronovibrio magnus]|uniref:hypothetical protein n=1 Tax=Desulfonatronovibrio magnus TaxID=698827 RepID=UPI0005EAD1A6|nr:hypothetical protein [Desulfonatronovibrio magnus]